MTQRWVVFCDGAPVDVHFVDLSISHHSHNRSLEIHGKGLDWCKGKHHWKVVVFDETSDTVFVLFDEHAAEAKIN